MYNNRRGCVQGDCIRIILSVHFLWWFPIEGSFPRRRKKTLERITKRARPPPPEARLLPGKELMKCSVLSACKVCEYSVDERCANYRSAEINMKQQTIRLFLVLVLAEQGSGNQIFNWTSPTLGITVAQTRGNTTCIMSRGDGGSAAGTRAHSRTLQSLPPLATVRPSGEQAPGGRTDGEARNVDTLNVH